MKTTVDLTKLLPRDGVELRDHVGMLPNVKSERTKDLKARISGAKAVTSVCCYCAVGCSTLAYVSDDGKLLDVEMRPTVAARTLGSMRPRSCWRCNVESMSATAAARRSSEMSFSATVKPDAAQTCAMPFPIWPAPITPTDLIFIVCP